jgi:hypothetical protein
VVDVTATGKGVTMKAIVQDRYGSPDILQLREVDVPVADDPARRTVVRRRRV